MSKLLEQIKKDQLKMRKLRLTAATKLLTTLIGESTPGGKEQATDESVSLVIKKFIKDIDFTISKQGRNSGLSAERDILAAYLPQEMTPQVMVGVVAEAKLKFGEKNIGALMGFAKTYAVDNNVTIDMKKFNQMVRG